MEVEDAIRMLFFNTMGVEDDIFSGNWFTTKC